MDEEPERENGDSGQRMGKRSRRVWVVLGIVSLLLIVYFAGTVGSPDFGDDTPYIDFDEPTATSDAESQQTTTAPDSPAVWDGFTLTYSGAAEYEGMLAQPTATPVVWASNLPPDAFAYPAIAEQVYYSDRVVRATLASVSPTVEELLGGDGVASTYRPIHELRFRVLEDLKGNV